MPSIERLLLLVTLLFTGGCTTLQTTYFNLSYQPLENVGTLAPLPEGGVAESRMVDDMALAAKQMYGDGYSMLGYSQFVSPLYPSLAPGYAAKYAQEIGAEVALLTPPVPGASNLHGYLVTYWAPYRAEGFSFGAWITDLPEDLLQKLGDQFNVVTILQTIHGEPAAAAGFRADDALLAIDGERVVDSAGFSKSLAGKQGEKVVVSVSRQGELLDIPITLQATGSAGGAPDFQHSPWENTAPTDWSSLSAANIAADFQRRQQRQAELDAAYQQGQLQARQYADSYASGSYTSSSSTSRGATDTRGGQLTREQRARGEYREFSQAYGSDPVRDYLKNNPDKGWNAKDWTYNAPKTYNYLFQYPAFVQ